MFLGQRATQFIKARNVFTGAADGLPRFEIDDSAAYLKYSNAQLRQEIAGAGNRLEVPLEAVLHHPELFEAYPQLRDMPCGFSNIGGDTCRGSTPDEDLSMKIGLAGGCAVYDGYKACLHELQHNVQKIEGFAKGTSPQQEFEKLVKARKARYGRALQRAVCASELPLDLQYMSPKISRLSVRFSHLSYDLMSQREIYKLGYLSQLNYAHAPGEVEAVEVEDRMHMSKDQRLATPPRISRLATKYLDKSGICRI